MRRRNVGQAHKVFRRVDRPLWLLVQRSAEEVSFELFPAPRRDWFDRPLVADFEWDLAVRPVLEELAGRILGLIVELGDLGMDVVGVHRRPVAVHRRG